MKARIVLVRNPRTLAGGRARLWERARGALEERTDVAALLDTRGDGEDARRIGKALAQAEADVVVAAGGDGTVGHVVDALLGASEPRPALGFLPLGTGNNAARSLGLLSLRGGGARAVDLAVSAIADGERREIDLGLANGRPFVGSFSLGMDARVLARRDRIRRRLGPAADGYALYLASFLLCLPRRETTRARLLLDGAESACDVYNLVAVSAPIYAGVFRFEAGSDCAGGRLAVHGVSGAREYVSEYPRAWLRHLRCLRGRRPRPSRRLRHARELVVELVRPLPAQVDGEELGRAASYRVRILPRAIRACTPRAIRTRTRRLTTP